MGRNRTICVSDEEKELIEEGRQRMFSEDDVPPHGIYFQHLIDLASDIDVFERMRNGSDTEDME
jgi:hypothetical protein